MSINYSYEDAVAKQKLALLPDKMLDWAMEVLLEQAHLMVGLAQIYVPVETGSLRNSIRVERGGEGLNWREVRVRAGGYVVNPKTHRLVDYAAFVEAKQPYMKPAFDQIKAVLATMIRNNVVAHAVE